MFHDDPPREKPGAVTPGEDLGAMSVEDLREREALLQAELERTAAMIKHKEAGRAAADAVFKH
ncbi:DUF1192 domain-containing protein [Marinicauda salina]|jgi:uncharacterized small protein (DUF1192 family)|uniref:DUF1192 domain-containing protein n=1 Tax=Marinicauda salina TaxID=2135793 RepID=A0A2U2BQP9_9PROT|nr:DUF1192 domain-containing protein [Marinicauda salina]PWE16326.1 DUF1192 domain-containing protein [Marinicauda salina]